MRGLWQSGQPFFSLVFTSSNHEPFEFPDGRIDLHEEPKNTVNNAVKYADWAMGQFFKKARQSSYWQDTLFLVVADHDNRVYGSNLIPVEKFRIPGLILGADTKAGTIDTLASQIDLAPTVLSMLGVSSCHPMIGRDLTLDSTSPGRSRPSLKPVIIAVLASFLLGASVAGFLAWRGYFTTTDTSAEIDFESGSDVPATATPSPSPTPVASETAQAAAAVAR